MHFEAVQCLQKRPLDQAYTTCISQVFARNAYRSESAQAANNCVSVNTGNQGKTRNIQRLAGSTLKLEPLTRLGLNPAMP